jgi:hypothetical protein
LIDDFYDEEIYKESFPYVDTFFKFIIAIYTIYLFYFKNANEDICIFLFFIEFGYIIFLLFKYVGWNDVLKIAEINITLEDPFTLLSLIQLPKFLIKFNEIVKNNFILFIKFYFFSFLYGIFQDLDNSLFGKYILKNRFSKDNNMKKYKTLYRLGLILIIIFINKKYINEIIKNINYTTTNMNHNLLNNASIFLLFYLLTSVISLCLQIVLEERKEHNIFIEKVVKTKKSIARL